MYYSKQNRLRCISVAVAVMALTQGVGNAQQTIDADMQAHAASYHGCRTTFSRGESSTRYSDCTGNRHHNDDRSRSDKTSTIDDQRFNSTAICRTANADWSAQHIYRDCPGSACHSATNAV